MINTLTARERAAAESEKSRTNAEHIAWAKATLAKFPFRNDLREMLAKMGVSA